MKDDLFEMLLTLSSLFQQHSQHRKAYILASALVCHRKEDPRTWRLLGLAALKLNRFEEAARCARYLRGDDPLERNHGRWLEAHALMGLGRREEAKASLIAWLRNRHSLEKSS